MVNRITKHIPQKNHRYIRYYRMKIERKHRMTHHQSKKSSGSSASRTIHPHKTPEQTFCSTAQTYRMHLQKNCRSGKNACNHPSNEITDFPCIFFLYHESIPSISIRNLLRNCRKKTTCSGRFISSFFAKHRRIQTPTLFILKTNIPSVHSPFESYFRSSQLRLPYISSHVSVNLYCHRAVSYTHLQHL